MAYFQNLKLWNTSKKELIQNLVKTKDMFWMDFHLNWPMRKICTNVFYIFLTLAPNDDERDEKGMMAFDEKTIPDYVISLDASDVFIKNRVMKIPEALTAGTKNSEDGKIIFVKS